MEPAGPSALHGRGLIASRDAPAGSILALYPVHALGDEKHCLADEAISSDFEAATSRPYRVDAGHASLKAWAPDLWVDASPNLPLVDGWLGHLVNDAAAWKAEQRRWQEHVEGAYANEFATLAQFVAPPMPDEPEEEEEEEESAAAAEPRAARGFGGTRAKKRRGRK